MSVEFYILLLDDELGVYYRKVIDLNQEEKMKNSYELAFKFLQDLANSSVPPPVNDRGYRHKVQQASDIVNKHNEEKFLQFVRQMEKLSGKRDAA